MHRAFVGTFSPTEPATHTDAETHEGRDALPWCIARLWSRVLPGQICRALATACPGATCRSRTQL